MFFVLVDLYHQLAETGQEFFLLGLLQFDLLLDEVPSDVRVLGQDRQQQLVCDTFCEK